MIREQDYIAAIRRMPKDAFVAAYTTFFLVGGEGLPKVIERDPLDFDLMTRRVSPADLAAAERLVPKKPSDANEPPLKFRVFPVRKVQDAFASMITIGRTSNNDIVLPHTSVSKFHAFFKIDGKRVELSDAGSRNGTMVGITQLVPKGPAVEVPVREFVKFGKVSLRLVDAAECWDRVRAG